MLHSRKRIEIVVEAVRASEVTALLDRLGATGWTQLPVLAGRGRQGERRGGDLSGVLDNVVIISICGLQVAERVIEGRTYKKTTAEEDEILRQRLNEVIVRLQFPKPAAPAK